jgi:uncharacterized membrane protein
MYISIFIFIIIDLIYLNFSKKEYENGMGVSYDNIKLIPAIISYVCLLGSYYFIVEDPVYNKYLRAGIYAIGIYGVYNATNLAVLPNYTQDLAIRDTAWGISLCVGVSFISQYINYF